VYDGEWPIINPLTETATAYGLDGEVFVIEGNTVQQKAASDAFLDYRLALIAYSNRLARVSDGESGQTLFIRVQLYTVDRAVDYVDPLKTNEAFEIFISPNGDTVFRVAGYVAFLRALETFSQLIAPGGVLTRLPIYIPTSQATRGVLCCSTCRRGTSRLTRSRGSSTVCKSASSTS